MIFAYLFHAFLYYLLYFPVQIFCRIKFGFVPARPPKVKGPSLIVCNHNTDYDMLMVGTSFGRHMYFVGSEHIYRMGWVSTLIRIVFAPIARLKGSTDSSAAAAMLRALRSGRNVCVFAEGNRSFNGITNPIHPTIGKLAKVSRANLVVYRLEGGYFTSPRWSRTLRRGKMRSVVAGVFTADELKDMTNQQIHSAVTRLIHENAYSVQDRVHTRYRGKRLAEGLEHIFFLCPKCRAIGSFTAEGDVCRCGKCGFSVRYTDYGYIAGTETSFRTVTQWDDWQNEELNTLSQENTEGDFFSDGGMTLRDVSGDHRSRILTEGTLAISRETLTVGDRSFSLGDISQMTMYGPRTVVFSVGDAHYEIKCDHPCCTRKYLRMFELLTKRPVTI